MRDRDEIQRAHDLITGVLSGVIRLPKPLDDDTAKAFGGFASVLCWMLQHESNFPNVLRSLDDLLAAAGAQRPARPKSAIDWMPPRNKQPSLN